MNQRNPTRQEKKSKSKRTLIILSSAAIVVLALGIAFIWMSTTSKPAGRYTPVTNFSHIHGLAVDPTNPNVLYVGTHLGLVRGVADSDWAWVGDLRADFMGFTMHPNGKVFYASGHKVPDAPMMGVARSSDGGFTWEIIALQGKVDFHALTLSRANPQILYGWYYRDRKLYKSTDGGRSWRHPSAQGLSDVIALATDGASEQTLWAATAHGLYRSTDGGETFVRVSFAGAAVITVAVDPSNPQVLYASLEAGLRQSTDGGQTWQAIGQDIHEIYHLAIDPTNAQVVYAAGDSAIYKSTDGGESWKLVKPAERGH